MYTTPLYLALKSEILRGRSRFHTPGHKGFAAFPFTEAAPFDLTEIPGLESLFESAGPLRETEEIYSRLYGSHAFISAGGSTLAIQTMLALVREHGRKVIMSRGAHRSAINAAALLDLQLVWAVPDTRHNDPSLPGTTSPESIAGLLGRHPDAACVYLTSPNYYGECEDIAALSQVCRKFRVPLVIDNAHGAHLAFVSGPGHPMALGADMCCDSLHKTLPALTGAALLHIKDPELAAGAKAAMSLFASTSPSYLIMLSADILTAKLESPTFRERSDRTAYRADRLRDLADERGFLPPRHLIDPFKLCLNFRAAGVSRPKFESALERHGISPEMIEGPHCVLMFSINSNERDFLRVEQLLEEFPAVRPNIPDPVESCVPECALPLRDAVFAPKEKVAVSESVGRTAAELVSFCPPGTAVVVPGEIISYPAANILRTAGITEINVVK